MGKIENRAVREFIFLTLLWNNRSCFIVLENELC